MRRAGIVLAVVVVAAVRTCGFTTAAIKMPIRAS